MDRWEAFTIKAMEMGDEPLLHLENGELVSLKRGYIPRLANLTLEDTAAKGLRKRKVGDKLEPAVHFTALEVVRDSRALMLSGPTGSGKTSFAKYLCFSLAAGLAQKGHTVQRNETVEIRTESWGDSKVTPCYFAVNTNTDFERFRAETLRNLVNSWSSTKGQGTEQLLIVLDNIDRGGSQSPAALADILDLTNNVESIRLLVLGDHAVVRSWCLPGGIARQQLLPLQSFQREAAISKLLAKSHTQSRIGRGRAAKNPAIFALSLASGSDGDLAEDALDEWLARWYSSTDSANHLVLDAYHRYSKQVCGEGTETLADDDGVSLLSSTTVQNLLVARHLATQPRQVALHLFRQDSFKAGPIIKSLLVRLKGSCQGRLIKDLMAGPGVDSQRGALLVSHFSNDDVTLGQVKKNAIDVINSATLSTAERVEAGRILSRIGDPRDLLALATVPTGTCIIGSQNHPNSAPSHTMEIEQFRIGLFPVANRDFARFIKETGRSWVSPDSHDPDMRNAPATNVTWHDAKAFCAWLTDIWRTSGRIGSQDEVGLPTEPQWERACRGSQHGKNGDEIFPWGASWVEDASNCEDQSLNQKCSVGLFSKGRSPYGCYDMTGQVWEWCTTLWGTDMGTPSFQYPWRADGREATEADENVRRVLRGGCFSSGQEKANCTYRGSLEPAGFWRGNGFRIVVNECTDT